MAASKLMIATTSINSMRVKPLHRRGLRMTRPPVPLLSLPPPD
jgi:hypothetical protein